MNKNAAFRILLVEDDDDHAELAMYHFRNSAPNAKLLRIDDGLVAARYLLKSTEAGELSPHLVLMDLKLPKLDGLGVLQQLRAEPKLLAVPVVMLSTSNADHDKHAAYVSGANGYVVKPSSFEAYADLVEGLLGFWKQHNRLPGAVA